MAFFLPPGKVTALESQGSTRKPVPLANTPTTTPVSWAEAWLGDGDQLWGQLAEGEGVQKSRAPQFVSFPAKAQSKAVGKGLFEHYPCIASA